MRNTVAVIVAPLLGVAIFGIWHPVAAHGPGAAPTDARKARPDIAGRVIGSNGKPVVGATVYVHTAAVRKGTSPYCPSCYPDCGKRTTTDATGAFRVPAVDPSLTFRLLVVRDGYEPTFVHVDPSKSVPVSATLKARPAPAGGAPDAAFLIGIIRDPQGQPVAGATIEARGEHSGDHTMLGTIPGVDPLAVSDDAGRFRLYAPRSAQSQSRFLVLVTARGLAPQLLPEVKPGVSVPVGLKNGAALRGIVRRPDGKPLAGIVVHLNQKNRNYDTFLGQQQIGTNAKGEFLFTNLAPDQDYYVCPAMESLSAANLAGPKVTVHLPGDSQTKDGLILTTAPGRRISGRLRLTDGKPVPAGTRVMVGRPETWDAQFAITAPDGTFHVSGVSPTDPVELAASLRGYKISHKTPGMEKANQWESTLTLPAQAKDGTGIEILYEPAK